MSSKLIRVLTIDGLELQGLLTTPETGPSDICLLHIHGLAGNFYENRFIDGIAAMCSEHNLNFLTFNNRGHDYISDILVKEKETGKWSYRKIGGAYEIFTDCIYDIQACLDFLKSIAVKSIILQGHSHGAIKAAYFLSQINNPDIIGTILLSPSDDIGLQREDLGKLYDKALHLSKSLIDEGKRDELMPEKYFEYPISASTYYESFKKASPLGIFNISKTDRTNFSELSSIAIPTIVVLATENEAFIGGSESYMESLEILFEKAKPFSGHIIQHSPHNYLGYEEILTDLIKNWLDEIFKGTT